MSAKPAEAPGAVGGDAAPINILIVDDEPANLNVLETVLDDPGYRLVRAGSADEALLALVTQEFALLILDIRLPDMTGFELAQVVKQRKKTALVPIIFLTAYYDKDQHALEGYGTGAVDFLTKPVNPSVLRSKVRVFADLHRGTQALLLEVAERRRVEQELLRLNETLEHRVVERSEALRQADSKLHAVMSSITDGVLMLDRDWRFTYFNERGASIFGMQAEQLVGACVWEILPHTRDSRFDDGFRRAVESRQTVSFEEFYPEPLGMWFQCHCYPSDDGLSVYFHDITDRREVEVQREQLLAAEQAARSEVERLVRAKEEFLATLSHELRTPLAAIVGWANILKNPRADKQTLSRGLDAITRNADAQSHLVNDLLEMSRIASGKLRMAIEQVDLNAVCAAAVDTARPAAEHKGVHLETRLADGVIEVTGDPTRLQQVVSNLLNNALKFTPPEGTITVATSATESHVDVTVADTGEGIAPAFLPQVFERFRQADGSAARVHGGLGLGLSIVDNLVQMHGGSVTARSDGKGLGATFTVRLPRADAADTGSARAAGAASPTRGADESVDADPDLRGIAVLLVDDNADVLEVERRMLCDCGATVTVADSAERALGYLEGQRFDVLLSDLSMPGKDGYALIRDIRHRLGLDRSVLPAIAITALVRDEDRARALEAGYQSFIHKPADSRRLAGAVRDLCGRPAPTESGRPSTPPALRALLVEDDGDVREPFQWLLEDHGLDVVACASGEEAEATFRRGRFEVVLTDVDMPGMSGFELARRLLADSPDTWIVFSTGHSIATQELAKLGSRVRSLRKPFEEADVRRLVTELRAPPVRSPARG